MSEFKKYQHIERWDRSEVNGLLFGECYIFPKIDGTNGQIYFKDGKVCCGSRNRDLTEDQKDNQGFRAFVNENLNIFEEFFKSHPNYRLFGEWLVPHTIKNYRDNVWRNFYVFDVVKENDGEFEYISFHEYSGLLSLFGIEFIEPMKIVDNPTEDILRKCADNNNYLMKDGFLGEGIVIKNYGYKNRFGHTIWGKLVRNEFSDKHRKVNVLDKSNSKQNIEDKIAKEYCTESLVLKTIAKIENDKDFKFEPKNFPELFNRIFYDIVNEDMWDAIKKFKNPTVDFRRLQRLIAVECKKYADI